MAMLHCSLFGASSLSLCTLKFPFPENGIHNKWPSPRDYGGGKNKPDVDISSLVDMCSTLGINSGKAETVSEFR